MDETILLFHWSPISRRASILKQGLVPHSLSGNGEWRAPFVCLAETPSMAYALSIAVHPEIRAWDLWQCWDNAVDGYEVIELAGEPGDDGEVPKEYRFYERVWKRDLWWVGTREGDGHG